jgi:hypothetical protein
MKKFVVATLVALLFLASMSLAQSLAQQSRPSTHTHGITDNVDRSVASHKLITFPLLMQQAGY